MAVTRGRDTCPVGSPARASAGSLKPQAALPGPAFPASRSQPRCCCPCPHPRPHTLCEEDAGPARSPAEQPAGPAHLGLKAVGPPGPPPCPRQPLCPVCPLVQGAEPTCGPQERSVSRRPRCVQGPGSDSGGRRRQQVERAVAVIPSFRVASQPLTLWFQARTGTANQTGREARSCGARADSKGQAGAPSGQHTRPFGVSQSPDPAATGRTNPEPCLTSLGSAPPVDAAEGGVGRQGPRPPSPQTVTPTATAVAAAQSRRVRPVAGRRGAPRACAQKHTEHTLRCCSGWKRGRGAHAKASELAAERTA